MGKFLMSKEVVYDKETSIDSVKNILCLPYTIFGSIHTVIYIRIHILNEVYSIRKNQQILFIK